MIRDYAHTNVEIRYRNSDFFYIALATIGILLGILVHLNSASVLNRFDSQIKGAELQRLASEMGK